MTPIRATRVHRTTTGEPLIVVTHADGEAWITVSNARTLRDELSQLLREVTNCETTAAGCAAGQSSAENRVPVSDATIVRSSVKLS
jgi:hypothetical protein